MIKIGVRRKLLDVAEIIACSKMHPAPLPKEQVRGFKVVVDKGFVKIENDQIAFATPERLATWIPRYSAMCISDAWGDLDQTAQKLLQAYRLFRTLELPKSAITELFLSLENDCGRDVLARLEEAACLEVRANESNVPLSSIYLKFCDVLPELCYTPSELADHLGPVLDATDSYSSWDRGKLREAIERLAEKSQEKAEALLDAFLRRPEQRVAELAASALKSLWKFDPDKAYKKALELTTEKLTLPKHVGIIALSRFNYELPSYEGELAETIARLDELCESDDADLLPTIAQAFSDLLANLREGSQVERVQKRLLHLASCKEPIVQFVISKVLQQRANDSGDSDWFWDALGYLSGVPACYQDILETLDRTIYGMVERNPERVTRYLENVVISRPYGREGESGRLPKLYGDTIFHLIDEQQSVLESTITRWFATKDPRLHEAAADLVGCYTQEARHQPGRTIRLDSSELNLLEEADVQRIMCALTGYVDNYKALASLLISVLLRENISEGVLELMESALDRVVLYNMPGLGGEYLRDLTQDADIPEHVHQVVTDGLERSDTYFAALKGRPNLKELMPPDIRVHRYYAESQKQLSHAYQKIVVDESRLFSLIPMTPIKYGRSSFSSESGNAASPVPMRAVRTELEMPRGGIIDPLGYELDRIEWRCIAIDGLPPESQSPSGDHCDDTSDERDTGRS